MNILVCLKQILDPEVPARDFRIDPVRRQAERGAANLVTNIFCENALETALQFRDGPGVGSRITVLTCGPASADDTLRKAIAMKADAAVRIQEEACPDPLAVAQVLAAAARKLGGFDLILVGREAGDWGAGQVGGLLAEELGLPCVAFVDRLEVCEGGLRVRRQTDTGAEVLELRSAVVLTITNDEHNVPRIPKIRDVMMSGRQPITTWTRGDLGLEGPLAAGYSEVLELFIPVSDRRCEFVAGETLAEQVDALARRVAEVVGAV